MTKGTALRRDERVTSRWAKTAGWLLCAVTLGGIGAACAGDDEQAEQAEQEAAAVSTGEQLFTAHCASCHGAEARGTEQGPPLVHIIYEPNHHPDETFYRAVREGVAPHHWNFGPMPPLAHVSDEEVAQIIEYVRELQRAEGIE